MKFLPLILSALFRKKTRTLLTLLSLAAAFLLIGLLQTVNSLFASTVDFLGVNRLIVQARTSFTQPLPMRMLPQLEAVPGVSRVSHSQFFGGQYQDAQLPFPQFAVNPQRLFDTYPEWSLSEDARRAFISTQDGAIAGRILAERHGWKVGDIIPLTSFIWTKADGSRDWSWRLVGIFDGKNAEWKDRARLMYLHYGYFDEARMPGAKGLAGVFILRVADPIAANEIASTVDATFENTFEETKTQAETEFQLGFVRQFGDIGFMMNLICAAVIFTILILTGYTMSQAVSERVPELAVLKCLGFSDGRVLWLVLGEALLLCSLGAGMGQALCALITANLPSSFPPLKTDWRVLLFTATTVCGLTLAVGLPPALRAKRIRIVDALAGR